MSEIQRIPPTPQVMVSHFLATLLYWDKDLPMVPADSNTNTSLSPPRGALM